MTSRRDLVPSTARNLQQLATDKAAALAMTKTPPALGGGLVQNPVVDPALRQQHALLPHEDTGLHSTIPADHVKPLHMGGPTAVPLPRPGHRGRLGRDDHSHASFSSDDLALNKQIVATHAGEFDVVDLNVKPVLAIIEDILRLGRPLETETVTPALVATSQSQPHLDKLDTDKKHYLTSPHLKDETSHVYHTPDHDTEIVRELAYPINRISNEIICKASAGGEAHSVAMELLKTLSNYPWDAKAVITFAAFVVHYGEFWLVEHHHTTNPLAKNIAALKDLPEIMEHAGELKRKFDQVLDLLHTAVKVIHCIVQFKELPSPFIKLDSPEMMAAATHIPTAVYWIIRSVLACASILLNLIGSGHEYISSTSESWEISSLAHKLSVIMDFLQDKLARCKNHIDRVKEEEAYKQFVTLMKTSHIDNMKVFRAMIRPTDDQKPLYDGSKRIKERLEVLKLKYVLLLISDLDLPHEELNVLHLIYEQNLNRHEYEVLWLPIVDPAVRSTTMSLEDADRKFYELRNGMPWNSVDHYSLIEPVAIRYIRDPQHWNFSHKPKLVVMDPQGRPSNLDALPMMWIWGSRAFNFTRIREEALWDDTTWNIELLADPIDPRISEWIRDNRVICLYGGEDIEWIRKFTYAARTVANALHIPLEMLYVGKRDPKDKVRRCHDIIAADKLSHTFPLQGWYDYTWYFWVRLNSMLKSRKHIGRTVDNDKIMQEIIRLLTFNSSEPGWALFSRGNNEMAMANGDVLLTVLNNYQTWEHKVRENPDQFVPVLDEEIHRTHPEHHCNYLILPVQEADISDIVVCSTCGKLMEKFIMFRCCTD